LTPAAGCAELPTKENTLDECLLSIWALSGLYCIDYTARWKDLSCPLHSRVRDCSDRPLSTPDSPHHMPPTVDIGPGQPLGINEEA